MPLVKMTIPHGQCGHFNQVGPFEKSYFFIVITTFKTNFVKIHNPTHHPWL